MGGRTRGGRNHCQFTDSISDKSTYFLVLLAPPLSTLVHFPSWSCLLYHSPSFYPLVPLISPLPSPTLFVAALTFHSILFPHDFLLLAHMFPFSLTLLCHSTSPPLSLSSSHSSFLLFHLPQFPRCLTLLLTSPSVTSNH